jgi:hypothetical protein
MRTASASAVAGWAAWCSACESSATSTLASFSGSFSISPRFHSTFLSRRLFAASRARSSAASERSTATTRFAKRAASNVR